MDICSLLQLVAWSLWLSVRPRGISWRWTRPDQATTRQELLEAMQQGQEKIDKLMVEVASLRHEVQESSAAAAAERPTQPGWAHWSASRGSGRRWLDRRGQSGAASSSMGEQRLVTPMCTWCGRRQPGVYCPDAYCRPCCQWRRGGPCAQHTC